MRSKRSVVALLAAAIGIIAMGRAPSYAGHATPSQHPNHAGNPYRTAPPWGNVQSPITSQSSGPRAGVPKVPHQQ